jgi:hypothetical protein
VARRDEIGVVVTAVATAAAFLFQGPIAGAVVLFLALCFALIMWTPLRGWFGIAPRSKESERRGSAFIRSRRSTVTSEENYSTADTFIDAEDSDISSRKDVHDPHGEEEEEEDSDAGRSPQ